MSQVTFIDTRKSNVCVCVCNIVNYYNVRLKRPLVKVEIVKNAEISKVPMQKLADKIAGIFVPVVTSIAVVVFLLWLLMDSSL